MQQSTHPTKSNLTQPTLAHAHTQVTVHLKGLTECYECTHRGAQQRSFPICTLRNTPDRPIHCIVWAKEMLFERLFGRPEEVTGAVVQGLHWGCIVRIGVIVEMHCVHWGCIVRIRVTLCAFCSVVA